MFESLSTRITQSLQKIRGHATLSESNIHDALKTIRHALIEADVALTVVDVFIADVTQQAVGQAVLTSMTPGDTFVNVVHQALVDVLGERDANAHALNLNGTPPQIILVAGLQGAGKTTTVAKLGQRLGQLDKKSVMAVSCDIYRPAAILQLERLCAQADIAFCPSSTDETVTQIAQRAMQHARQSLADVLLIDTAGRLHIDQTMMDEISILAQQTTPSEILFVVDSMTGQDAANTAKAFADVLPLTGVVLTKTDGDSRGGAALSVKHITQKPIKFVGQGERLDALDAFHPERMAQQILGMGDIVALAEQAQRHIDEKTAKRVAKKVKSGAFDLQDFRDQLQQMNQMGGIGSIMSKLPGMGALATQANQAMSEQSIKRMMALIDSMTPKERALPDIISGTRKRRITQGSGTSIADLNQLLKQFKMMQKMMKKFKGQNMASMMKKMQGMMPKGF